MNTNPQTYHGEWWVPAVADHDICMVALNPEQMMGLEKKYTGTLTYYGDEDSVLELYRVSSSLTSSHYVNNRVMWGKDANGRIFTLFNVVMKEKHGFDISSIEFVVGAILIGGHVLSIDGKFSKKCVVRFPYLNNWLFYETKKYLNPIFVDSSYKLDAAFGRKTLLEVVLEQGLLWKISNDINIAEDVRGISIKKNPLLEIESSEPISLKSVLKQIGEFEQFLSIALYSNQSFENIQLLSIETGKTCDLLIKRELSFDPLFSSLIKFDLLKEELPSMLVKWHENFDNIAPISSYLIDSLQKKNSFDVPDFLIIAQALDGYHKRFVNKKDGWHNRPTYQEQIEILLNQFSDVKAIKACRINPVVLKDSRHKYSHLYPDDEKSLAVEGDDLYWLTEKCKILLTCCILNMIGLTNKEINLCFEQSPIQDILNSLPPEID